MNGYEDDKKLRQEELARYFSRASIKVHIKKKNGSWFNGFIKDVGSDFFIIEDNVNGHEVVFFQELKNTIVEYQEEE